MCGNDARQCEDGKMFELHFGEESDETSERVRWKEGSTALRCSAGKGGLYDKLQKRGPVEEGPEKEHHLHFRLSLVVIYTN